MFFCFYLNMLEYWSLMWLILLSLSLLKTKIMSTSMKTILSPRTVWATLFSWVISVFLMKSGNGANWSRLMIFIPEAPLLWAWTKQLIWGLRSLPVDSHSLCSPRISGDQKLTGQNLVPPLQFGHWFPTPRNNSVERREGW